jgi:hypothetical protein
VFEGIVGSSFDGDISIDDIFVNTKYACRQSGSCSFEDSLCLWSQLTTNSFNFLRITAQQLQQIVSSSSIQADTTTNTKYGHFLWIGSDYFSSSLVNKTTTLYSETFFSQNYLNGSCLIFSYLINGGQDPGKINIYSKLYKMTKKLQFSTSGNQGANWKKIQIPFALIGSNFELFIEAVLGSSGQIAIDDVEFYDTDCSQVPTGPTPTDTFDCGDGNKVPAIKVCDFFYDCSNGLDEKVCADCDFQNSTCKWKDVSSGSLAWIRGQAGNSTNGPSVDHSTNTPYGYYMYVDSQVGLYDKARLELTQVLRPCSPTCELEFYYHMFGITDDISVDLLEENGFSPLLELSGDFGDRWNLATIRLGRIARDFRFLIKGIRYFNGDNDLAIDDIRLRNCEFPAIRPNGCPSDYFTCERKACVPNSRKCDLIDDCGDNSDEKNCVGYTQCDFENGLCDWQHDNSMSLKWTWHKGETDSFGTGPSRDHTLGTSEGHYMYLEVSATFKGQKARLISSTFRTDSSKRCELRIFYHMLGRDIGALNIYTRSAIGGLERQIFNRTREIGDFWERGDIRIIETNPFQIIIEGVTGQSFMGDIGIDDISFTDGCILDNTITIPTIVTQTTVTTVGVCGGVGFQCPVNNVLQCVTNDKKCNFINDCDDKSDEINCGDCDFENSWCGWYDDSTGATVWTRKQAPSPNPTGPQVDHTQSPLKGGSYLITEFSTTAGTFWDYAALFGPVMQGTISSCKLSLWIYMGSPLTSDLKFYITNANYTYIYTYLYGIFGTLGSNWQKYEIPIGKTLPGYQIEINSSPNYVNYTYYSEVALDDLKLINCGPSSQLSIDQSLDCDFDIDFCSYSEDSTSEFLWERIKGPTYSYETGPNGDHTSGSGYYIFIETSYPQKQGDKARIYSSIQTKVNQDICIIFWYHMYGPDIDRLNVYLDQYTNVNNSNTFNRTLVWTKQSAQGNKWIEGRKQINSILPWKIVFEGIVGKSFQGDISLDDLSSVMGKCPPEKNCDFEADLCGYNNVNDGITKLTWKLGQPTNNSIDHSTSTNQGLFAYVDLNGAQPNNFGRLISPVYEFKSLECLQFWFIINGGSGNALINVYLKQATSSNYGTPIWSKKSQDGVNEWRYGQVKLDAISNNFFNVSIMFEAVKGNIMSSITENYLGIDDVNINIGSCPDPINCNFEDYTTCSWQQSKYHDIDWLLNKGQTDSWDTGPHVDVTLGTDEGVYLYLESSYPAVLGNKAILISDYIEDTSASPSGYSCFGLYYFMHGLDVGEFNIYLNDSVNGKFMLN